MLDKYSEADFGISEEFIEMEIEKKLHGYKKMYGRGFDDFEKDKKEEYIKFVEEIKAHVIKGIKIDVILQCISNKEGIKVGEEDLLQARNDYPYLQQAPNAEGMISFLRRKKAMEKLVECAVME